MADRLWHNKKGYTLIEVMVSLAILGLIVVPVANLFLSSVVNNRHARDEMEAGQLAQEVMESLKNNPQVPVSQGATVRLDRYSGRYSVQIVAAPVSHTISGTANTPLDISGEDPVVIPSASPSTVDYQFNGFSAPTSQDAISFNGTAIDYQSDVFPGLNDGESILLEMVDSDASHKKIRLTVGGSPGSPYEYTPSTDGSGNQSVSLVINDNTALNLNLTALNNSTGNVALNVIIVRGLQGDGTNYPDNIITGTAHGTGDVKIIKNLLSAPANTDRLYDITVHVFRVSDARELSVLQSYKRMK